MDGVIGDVLFWTFASVSTLYVLHLGFYLVGANLYDIWQFRRQHERRGRLEYELPRRPLVTVLIPAHNEEKVIERCLESIRHSTYRNIQVIAVNDASTDRTLAIMRRYRREHPELDMVAASTPRNVGKGGALNYALRRFAKGELVMTVDADSVIAPHTIERAVSYFDDPMVAGVAANVRVMDESTILGTLQKLEHMIGYRSKKVYTLLNCEFVIGGVASTYRMDVLREVGFYDTDVLTEDIGLSMKVISSSNKARRLVYAADVEARTEGVRTYKALFKQRFRWKYGSLQVLVKYRRLIGRPRREFTSSLTIYRLPVAVVSEIVLLLTPLMWLYVAAISLAARNPLLIIGAYCTITLYTLVTLWFDEHTTLRKRIALSIDAFHAYFMFYIMDIVQFTGASRCIYRIKKLLTQQSTGSIWVSPERSGRQIVDA